MKKRQAFKIQRETLHNLRFLDYPYRTHRRAVARIKMFMKNRQKMIVEHAIRDLVSQLVSDLPEILKGLENYAKETEEEAYQGEAYQGTEQYDQYPGDLY